MSEDVAGPANPSLSSSVAEVQGHFPNDAALQDAIGRLTLLGLDRADLSVPQPHAGSAATPDAADAAPSTLDTQQVRTMASGLTGAAVGTGLAAVLATGGLAAPLVAAAAVAGAVGVSAATSGVGVAADEASSTARDQLGAQGQLILAARITSADQRTVVEDAMRAAGATEVKGVDRAADVINRGVRSASWTGM